MEGPWFKSMLESTDIFFPTINAPSHPNQMPSGSQHYFSASTHLRMMTGEVEGSLVAKAYITDSIEDISHYIPLIYYIENMTENDKLYIYFDSGGGYVSTGSAVASSLAHSKGTSFGIARGFCCSSASYMWSACTHQHAEPLAVLMYHMSSHMDIGNSIEIMDKAKSLVEYIRKGPLELALGKGHITDEELELIMKGKQNVYISAQEMNRRLASRSRQVEEDIANE